VSSTGKKKAYREPDPEAIPEGISRPRVELESIPSLGEAIDEEEDLSPDIALRHRSRRTRGPTVTDIEEPFLSEEETERLAGEQGTILESEIVPQLETAPP